MINIDDEGVIINVFPSGEYGAVLCLLSREHGIVKGYVRHLKKGRPEGRVYHLSNRVSFQWRSRLEDNLGNIKASLITEYAPRFINDKIKMTIIMATAAMIYASFKEFERLTDFYDRTVDLLSNPTAIDYLRWELLLLKETGFGLDLSKCAVTGKRDDLLYVSPKSGRAVSKDAASPYVRYLLPLPSFLINDGDDASDDDIKKAFALSGYFLRKHIFVDKKIPEIRTVLEEYLLKKKDLVYNHPYP